MVIVQVVPHCLVGFEASVVLIQLSAAFIAVPTIAMNVEHGGRRRFAYELVIMDAS